MKKIIICSVCMLCAMYLQAQDVKFGITGGYLNAEGKVKFDDITVSASESGFYIGALADLTLDEQWHLQPELLYASVDESDALILPVLFKYYAAPDFNIQAGPQFVFSLEDSEEDFSNFALDIGAGLGYDITEHFLIEARYSFQLNNSYTGSEDITARANYLTIGVGYTF